MKTWLRVVLVAVLIALAVAAGYVWGALDMVKLARHAVESESVQPKSLPNGWCGVCEARYPEWVCWLNGC